MSVQDATPDCCAVCLNPLGETFEVTGRDGSSTRFVTSTLHQPATGNAHRVHQICIFRWFKQQEAAEDLRSTLDPSSPFTCHLCRHNVTVEQAEAAAGLQTGELATSLRNTRLSKITRQERRILSISPFTSRLWTWTCI